MAIEQWRRGRNRILIDLDVVAAAKQMPGVSSLEVVLLALHKARYVCTDIPANLRHASAAYLRERGSTDLYGQPILPEGQLPE